MSPVSTIRSPGARRKDVGEGSTLAAVRLHCRCHGLARDVEHSRHRDQVGDLIGRENAIGPGDRGLLVEQAAVEQRQGGAALQLGVKETDVEAGVACDQNPPSQQIHQLPRDL